MIFPQNDNTNIRPLSRGREPDINFSDDDNFNGGNNGVIFGTGDRDRDRDRDRGRGQDTNNRDRDRDRDRQQGDPGNCRNDGMETTYEKIVDFTYDR